jgi:hypothetical protein
MNEGRGENSMLAMNKFQKSSPTRSFPKKLSQKLSQKKKVYP